MTSVDLSRLYWAIQGLLLRHMLDLVELENTCVLALPSEGYLSAE